MMTLFFTPENVDTLLEEFILSHQIEVNLFLLLDLEDWLQFQGVFLQAATVLCVESDPGLSGDALKKLVVRWEEVVEETWEEVG